MEVIYAVEHYGRGRRRPQHNDGECEHGMGCCIHLKLSLIKPDTFDCQTSRQCFERLKCQRKNGFVFFPPSRKCKQGMLIKLARRLFGGELKLNWGLLLACYHGEFQVYEL